MIGSAGRRCWWALLTRLGSFTAVEVTYLAPNGRRAIDLRLSRKTVGPVPPGTAVRIDPSAPEMLVAEGFFNHPFGERVLRPTRLGADVDAQPAQLVGARGRAVGADRRRSRQGRRGFRRDPAAPAGGSGVRGQIALPPEPHGDWNEAARPA